MSSSKRYPNDSAHIQRPSSVHGIGESTRIYALPATVETIFERGLKFAFICALHLGLLGTLATTGLRPQFTVDLSNLDVRIIEDKPPPKQEPVKPKPLPAVPRPVMTRPAPPAPAPAVMTAAAETPPTSASFAVPLQPAESMKSAAPLAALTSAPAPAPALAPAPAPVSAARFDADYLHNPAPEYPAVSRRRGDQGRVLLRVLVSTHGTANAVQVQSSSTYPRLDEVAMETVRQWRFVPAKRGAELVEDWVLVPIVFRLDS